MSSPSSAFFPSTASSPSSTQVHLPPLHQGLYPLCQLLVQPFKQQTQAPAQTNRSSAFSASSPSSARSDLSPSTPRTIPSLPAPSPAFHATDACASPNQAIMSLNRALSTHRSSSGHPRAPRTILSSPSSTTSPSHLRLCLMIARMFKQPRKHGGAPWAHVVTGDRLHDDGVAEGIACTMMGSQRGSPGKGLRTSARRAMAVAQREG